MADCEKESTRKKLELKELGKNPAAGPEKSENLKNELRETGNRAEKHL